MPTNLDVLKKSLEDAKGRREKLERQQAASDAIMSSLLARLQTEYGVQTVEEAKSQIKSLREKEEILRVDLEERLSKVDGLLREVEVGSKSSRV